MLRSGNGGEYSEENGQAEKKKEMEVRIVGGRVLQQREDATLAS